MKVTARHDTGHWEHFPHEADMGVRGIAPSLEQAFAQAAVALTAVITDPATVRPQETVTITAADPDPELLFVDFLNAVILEMAERRMLFSLFHVTLSNGGLTATAQGETVDIVRHQPAVEIKGATYTELAVKHLDNGSWLAQCVVDV
jgi:tRNA nucleotidyltransferase (CCA-adding enzyme)